MKIYILSIYLYNLTYPILSILTYPIYPITPLSPLPSIGVVPEEVVENVFTTCLKGSYEGVKDVILLLLAEGYSANQVWRGEREREIGWCMCVCFLRERERENFQCIYACMCVCVRVCVCVYVFYTSFKSMYDKNNYKKS